MTQERLALYLTLSEQVPGWTRGVEAHTLSQLAYELPDKATVVEIGAFLGSGTILLAGARKLRRSGHVHSVDPFDGSGDAYSVPHYAQILNQQADRPPLVQFQANLAGAGLQKWATGHVGKAQDVAAHWTVPIDMLYMDGDQSPNGVQSSFDAWQPWLKPDATLVLHNSDERAYAESHDGHYRLRKHLERTPGYRLVNTVASLSIFRRAPA